MASVRSNADALDPVTAELRPAFRAELAKVNLQRLFWLLIAGLATRLASLAFNHFSAVSSDVLAAMQWFDLVLIPPLLVMTRRLRRPGASVRLAWILILFVMWGTLGMAVIQALFSAGDLGYRGVYVFGVMIVGIAYVLPPRLIIPAFTLNHALYVGLVLTGDFDARFKLASLADGTLGVVFAAGVSLVAAPREMERLPQGMHHRRAKPRAGPAQHRDEGPDVSRRARPARPPPRIGQRAGDRRRSRGSRRGAPAAKDATAAGECSRSSRACSMPMQRNTAAASQARRAVTQRRRSAQRCRDTRPPLPAGPAPAANGSEALGQVLDNLIGNALKFAPAGSTVDVSLAAAAGGWAGEVRDEGPGVPADEQPELFGKFRRGTNALAGGEHGFGLGLFIVRQLLASAGGDVSYADRAPRGAVFRVTLPSAP